MVTDIEAGFLSFCFYCCFGYVYVCGLFVFLSVMAGNARKLLVEVLAAKGLMPKDGEGSCNAYCVVWISLSLSLSLLSFVVASKSVLMSFLGCLSWFRYRAQLDYDGQRKRTKVKIKDLDPTWNEKVHAVPLSPLFAKKDIEKMLLIARAQTSTSFVFLQTSRAADQRSNCF